MVNGSRYYRALEIVSIASALSSALTITHARSESINADSLNSNFLQLGKSGGRSQPTVYTLHHAITCQHCDTHYFSRLRTHNLPIVSSIESIKNCKPVGELDRALLSFKQPTRPHRTATPSVDLRSDHVTETAFTGCACALTGGARTLLQRWIRTPKSLSFRDI